MNISERLRKLLPALENDGSKELANQYMALLKNAEDMASLMQNESFARILDRMKEDFKMRVDKLVRTDPELAAMKRMFIRTVGLKGAEAKIEAAISEYIDSTELEA
jgi:uncharacterized protein YeeX (DUF496 family)